VFKFAEIDEPWAIAVDAQDNIFASLTSNSLGDGVKKLTLAGVKSDFSPRLTGTVTRYNGLKVGPGGALYGVTFERRILQIPAAGGAATNWVVIANTSVRLNDLDFDRDGNLWTAGSLDLHRVRQDKNVKSFSFTGTIRGVRVYNDAVYLAGNRNNQETVWRVPIVSADQVGPEEEYFNFSAKYPGAIYAITFAADGDLLIGTDAPEAMVVVRPDKSANVLYTGLFPTKCFSFAWGEGNFLYATQEKKTVVEGTTTRLVEPQTVLSINLLKKGAPYYGRGDQ
jgi:sugar lactone lactonase YvrE